MRGVSVSVARCATFGAAPTSATRPLPLTRQPAPWFVILPHIVSLLRFRPVLVPSKSTVWLRGVVVYSSRVCIHAGLCCLNQPGSSRRPPLPFFTHRVSVIVNVKFGGCHDDSLWFVCIFVVHVLLLWQRTRRPNISAEKLDKISECDSNGFVLVLTSHNERLFTRH